MPAVLVVLFLLGALVCFLLAAFAVPVRKVNTVALGLALWVFPALWSAMESLG